MSIPRFFLIAICAMIFFMFSCEKKDIEDMKPNVVLIFLDDAGWSDFGPFEGAENITPQVDKLASEGIVYTNFHVPQGVCSASRAALLTGCYPERTKVFGAHAPNEKALDRKFSTIAEQLKLNGYKTGWFGKWHLGDVDGQWPHQRGFDETAGLMYSNDMWKYHPTDPVKWGKYPIKYWENGQVIIDEVDSAHQKLLTKWSSERAMNFIEENAENPFFLYLAYSMPHVPIFCSEEFEGKSGKGLYADVIMELDHGIGMVMDKLKENDLDQNTVIIFSSDNGPWTVYGNHAGKTIFREAKATSFEGGTRTQLIIKYPGILDAGQTSNRFLLSIDLLPTICQLTGSPLPENIIDGEDILSRLSDKDHEYSRDYHAFTNRRSFNGIFSKDGRWKLHLPHSYRHVVEYGADGQSGKYTQNEIDFSLFDMGKDPYETTNVIEDYPEITKELMEYVASHKALFFDSALIQE
jgi:arylsulfatase A